ncbi:MAG: radical SAM protein [Elusimicrobia bacterium]|nr:radical SAM protein [Elusimicrobiota bacterium]
MGSFLTVFDSATLSIRQKFTLPQTLIFFVTSRCNAKCNFCLYYDQVDNPTAKARELRLDEIEKFAKNYGPLHYLAVSGGEPFVREDVAEICQLFIDHCRTKVVDIPSNCFFTDRVSRAYETLAGRNPNTIFELQMSLDAIGEEHDQIRKVPHLFDHVKETYKLMASLRERRPNIKIKINMVYIAENKDRIPDIARQLLDLFDVDRIQLTYPHGRLEHASGLTGSLSIAEFKKMADALHSEVPLRQKLDFHTLGVRSTKLVYTDLLQEASQGKNVGSYCNVGGQLVVLDEAGNVFPCEPLWENVGNIRSHNYDLRAVINSSKMKEFRSKYLGPGKCNCTWSCAIQTSISVNPALIPAIMINAAKIAWRSSLGESSAANKNHL